MIEEITTAGTHAYYYGQLNIDNEIRFSSVGFGNTLGVVITILIMCTGDTNSHCYRASIATNNSSLFENLTNENLTDGETWNLYIR